MTPNRLFSSADDLDTVLGRLAGYASLCWSESPTGVFDSEKAVEAVKQAADRIREVGL